MTQVAPFTNDDIRQVINSWNTVQGDISGIGIAVFMKMFEQHPDYHLLFKKFKHVPIKDLPNDSVFVNHAVIVAKGLDEAIMNLEDLNTATKILLKIGKIHSNKNMKDSHFIHCNDAIIFVLKTALKEKFDKEVEEAWNKVLPTVAKLITEGMKVDK